MVKGVNKKGYIVNVELVDRCRTSNNGLAFDCVETHQHCVPKEKKVFQRGKGTKEDHQEPQSTINHQEPPGELSLRQYHKMFIFKRRQMENARNAVPWKPLPSIG